MPCAPGRSPARPARRPDPTSAQRQPSRLFRRLSGGFEFAHGGGVAQRDIWIIGISADIGQDLPGAGAFGAGGLARNNSDAGYFGKPERIDWPLTASKLGLAGDGERFERTWVIEDGKPTSSIVSAVGFCGDRVQIGHGSMGGWDLFGPKRQVTKSTANVLYELNGEPALALYKLYLGDRAAELPASALLFPLSLRISDDDEKSVVRTVLSIDEDNVQVDIGFKSEGLVPAWEFMNDDGTLAIKVGDQVDVLIETAEDDDGRIVLSKEKAERLKIWDEISNAYERDEAVEGTMISRVKGGLSVDIGVKAFLPGSQVDLRPVRNLEALIGEKANFKIIKFNKRRGNIVLSRRALLETERRKLREPRAEGRVVVQEGVARAARLVDALALGPGRRVPDTAEERARVEVRFEDFLHTVAEAQVCGAHDGGDPRRAGRSADRRRCERRRGAKCPRRSPRRSEPGSRRLPRARRGLR